MLTIIKRATLQLARGSGMFRAAASSEWRRQRLLILCYHGISLEDEHEWRPGLYMSPETLAERLTILERGDYKVLPLGEALQRRRSRDLPPRSVALTFDDGTYDFFKQAHPLLKKFGFPVTVYQTTYYSDYQKPIFNLICSYMLWQRRGQVLGHGDEFGLEGEMDLRTEESRQRVVRELVLQSEANGLTGAERNELAARLAGFLGLDYGTLLAKRLLHIMSASEMAQLSRDGVDFQLHTHRHRTPRDESLFRQEIRDNRNRIEQATGRSPAHFCYPSGIYAEEFLGWLRVENVVSATTCDAGLAGPDSDPLLLPRLVDTPARSTVEFEGWLAGVSAMTTLRKRAAHNVPAAAGTASQIRE